MLAGVTAWSPGELGCFYAAVFYRGGISTLRALIKFHAALVDESRPTRGRTR